MDKLKTRILQDGKCYEGGILKVDSFINHQMDPNLMMEVAKEFGRLFADLHINKIVTIETSGIAPAILVGYIMQLPVVSLGWLMDRFDGSNVLALGYGAPSQLV